MSSFSATYMLNGVLPNRRHSEYAAMQPLSVLPGRNVVLMTRGDGHPGVLQRVGPDAVMLVGRTDTKIGVVHLPLNLTSTAHVDRAVSRIAEHVGPGAEYFIGGMRAPIAPDSKAAQVHAVIARITSEHQSLLDDHSSLTMFLPDYPRVTLGIHPDGGVTVWRHK